MFRIEPALPAQAYKTYAVSAPLATHWRKATCAEVECPHFINGWATKVLPGSDLEDAVRASGRRWSSEERTEDGYVRFVFPAGQACFQAAAHRLPLDRAAIYTVRRGDWRGDLGEHRNLRPEDWVDDFQNHQQRLAETL